MEQGEIERIIIHILTSNNYGIKMPRGFSIEESLLLRGIIDSFGVFLFIHELEACFGIKIEKNEIHPGNLETIKKVTTFVYGKKIKE